MELLFRPKPQCPYVSIPDEVRSAFDGNNLEDSEFQKAILIGLQSKNCYQGTVSPATIARRRIRNKAARKARRANRTH